MGYYQRTVTDFKKCVCVRVCVYVCVRVYVRVYVCVIDCET